MRVEVVIGCPGCKLSNKVTLKKPTLFKAMFLAIECDSCGSEFQLKYTKPLDGKKNSVQTWVRLSKPSEKLVAMLKEEAEHDPDAPESATNADPAEVPTT